MVGNYTGEEREMQESMAAWRDEEAKKADARMVAGFNLLRDAVVWFDSHSVEKQLGHLPQWMAMARELLARC